MHFLHLFSCMLLAMLSPLSADAQNIDPTSVPMSTRQNWCYLQTSTCPLLCPQIGGSLFPTQNSCNSTTLAYSCVCSNNMSPNASQYTQTIPYFECTTFNNQCADNCGNDDSVCVSDCRTQHLCGAQDPPKGNKTLASPTMKSSAANTASTAMATGFGGPESSSAAVHGGGMPLVLAFAGLLGLAMAGVLS